MGAYDFFFAAQPVDGTSVQHINHSAATNAGAELKAEGTTFTFASAPSPTYFEGEHVAILESFVKQAYCRVTRVNGTSITVLPIQSLLDSAGAIGYTFPSGSYLYSDQTTPTRAVTLVIDLSDAPEASYSYLVVGCGWIGCDTASAITRAQIRSGALLDDPYSGTADVGQAYVTHNSTSQSYNFVASRRVTLSGGQRYEFHLEFGSQTLGATATCTYGTLAAVRYSAIVADADNGTSAQETNATGSWQNAATLGANIAAGTYLICGTYVAGCSSTSEDVQVQVTKDGSTQFAYAELRPKGTSDFYPGGFFGAHTLGATNEVRVQFKATGAATAKIKNIQLCAIPLPTWVAEALTSEHLSDNLSQTNPSGWVTLKTSNSVALTAGMHLEAIACGLACDDYYKSRPSFTGAPGSDSSGRQNFAMGTASTQAWSTFWLRRWVRTTGSVTNAIEGQVNDSTGVIRCKKPYFTWLREAPEPPVRHDTPVSIVVDLENGGVVLRSWNATGVARRYRKHLSVANLMSRVLVNGTAYTRLTSTITESDLMNTSGAMADSQWYWRPESQDLYVQFPSGTSPTSATNTVVAIPLLLVGRAAEDLSDAAGVALPYAPRVEGVPGMTQELSSGSARFEVSTSLGKLSLAAADGAFDDLVVQHYFEGVRAKVRRGWSSLSDDLNDFETIADAVVGMPSSDFETVELRLFDRGLNLGKAVATVLVNVKEGNTADSSARTRYDQLLPVIYGKVNRVVAYRMTTNYLTSDWNEYQFAGHAVSQAGRFDSVTGVYLDETTLKMVGTASVDADSSGTYRNAGKVRVKNDAFSDATRPGDRIYLDVVGKTADGTYSGAPIQTPGAIARDLLTTHGGLTAADLSEPTFRLMDRRWRWQLTSGTWIPSAIKIGLLVEGDETVAAALSRLCGDIGGGYWIASRQGRVGLGVCDYDKASLLTNGGFETNANSAYPWAIGSGATLAVTSARKYDGTLSLEVTNGGTPNATAYVTQQVILPRAGSYVLTALVTLLTGTTNKLTLGVHLPDGTIARSDPLEIQTSVWTRVSFAVDVPRGFTGGGYVYVYPAKDSTTATQIGIDNVEFVPVAAVLDDTNSKATGLEFRDEHYYEAAVAYDVNLQDAANASKLVMTDGEARGLGAAVNEGKFAVQSSSRADLGTPLLTDTSSAAGVAAPLVTHFGRTRHVLSIDAMMPPRIPVVGERVFHRAYGRLPELVDSYPLWVVTRVDYDGRNAQSVSLELERQADPVLDRVELAPDSIPMGAIALTLSSGSVTDYTESTDLQDMYIRASGSPDLTEQGNFTHAHDLTHTHNIPSHDHGTTLTSHGIDTTGDDDGYPWLLSVTVQEYPPPFGPAWELLAARGLSAGHTHTLPGTSKKVGAATGTSSDPITTLETVPGGNGPAYRRVRFMQHSGNSASTINQNLIVGYESATIPAGWTRVTALDGYYVRGATTNGSVSTTVATSSFTPNAAGSSLKVASSSNIAVRKRLTVTNGGNTCAVIVTAQNGATDWQVTPLYEVGNATGVSYPVGSTVAGGSDAVNQTYSPNNHDHGATMPTHTHTGGGHAHGTNEFHLLGTAAPLSSDATVYAPGTPAPGVNTIVGNHTDHAVQPTAPASSDVSGSAGGTLSGATTPVPDAYQIVWMQPADANQTVLPAGTLLLWAQSSTPPPGYEKVTAANAKLIKGAASGQGASSISGGHAHTMTPAAHTFAHNHGGTGSVKSGDTSAGELPWDTVYTTSVPCAAGPSSSGYLPFVHGHAHLTNYSIAEPTSDPTLQAASAQSTGSVSGGASLPRHKRLLLIRKL